MYQPVDPARSHPYKTYATIDEINSGINKKNIEIKSGTFYKIIKKYNIKNKQEYYYLSENTPRYSDSFIQWCTNNINKQKDWISNLKK